MRVKESKELRAKSEGKKVVIHGNVNGKRVSSRILEEQIQQAVHDGARELHIIADGQHGIGGRIWSRGETIKGVLEELLKTRPL